MKLFIHSHSIWFYRICRETDTHTQADVSHVSHRDMRAINAMINYYSAALTLVWLSDWRIHAHSSCVCLHVSAKKMNANELTTYERNDAEIKKWLWLELCSFRSLFEFFQCEFGCSAYAMRRVGRRAKVEHRFFHKERRPSSIWMRMQIVLGNLRCGDMRRRLCGDEKNDEPNAYFGPIYLQL